MAKKATQRSRSQQSVPTEIVVKYDLFSLPTAFHKAGLAGLLMLIESLLKRHLIKRSDLKVEVSATTATITFTEPLLQSLMDDLYDAKEVEVAVTSKWADAEIARPPTAKEKEAGTSFVYKVVQPRGQFLRDNYPDEDGLWLKLWRDMLWDIPRGRPTTRIPYNQRAEGSPCKEGANAWADLIKVQKSLAANGFHTEAISSALLPGAQAVNAENVPFEGRAEQNLLLHFWPLAILLFVPQKVDTDGSTDFVGYALAVPEVSNLPNFVAEFPEILQRLNEGLKPEHLARGYRPASAVIDLPAEGGLAFFHHLAAISVGKVEGGVLRFSISGVEYLCLIRQRNNVKTVANGRVTPAAGLVAAYRQIVAPPDESHRYRNPLFRRGLLASLLDGELEHGWHRPFARTLNTFEAGIFIRQPRRSEESEERRPPHFANDAAKMFQREGHLFQQSLERSKAMPEPERLKPPPSVIVNRVVRNYLRSRAEDKTGIKLEKFEADEKIDWAKVPAEFNEAKQKVAESLFLEFRSRKNQAFVEHFAATFFSTRQRLSDADREILAGMLVGTDGCRDDLKTLTLLSLSANS